ncbi:MAG TPA: DUF502 domain-containing protein [Candidatus Hydrogenedens sp.]|nr:DUF502 domain-containing protein [Candidatus Hydrogenedens sp.]
MEATKKKKDKKTVKLRGSIRRTFLSGILLIIPLGLTILILRFIYFFTVGRIAPYIYKWFPEYPTYLVTPISIVLIIVFVYLVGLFFSFFLVRQIFSVFEMIIGKIPFVKAIYNAVKQMTVSIIEQFTSQQAHAIVLVPYPHEKVFTMGLLLGKVLLPDEKEYYKVFIPTVPNVTIGVIQFYPAEKIYKCPIDVEQAIEIIVSSGASMPQKLSVEPLKKNENKIEKI